MGRTGRVLYMGLMTAGLLAFTGSLGCQQETSGTTGGKAGSAGDGGSGAGGSTGGTSTGGSTGGTGATGGSTGGTGTGGQNNDACEMDVTDATIYQVTNASAPGAIGKDIKVRLENVIAMSSKILISHSNNSGSCLWGVFISATKTADGTSDLTETEPYSGVIVLSYGPNAAKGSPCLNRAGAIAAGLEADADVIPDDIKVGDQLKVVGKTSKFIQSSCGQKPEDTDIGQAQIFTPCKVEKLGDGAVVPAAHVLTTEELAMVAKQKSTDAGVKDFHDGWAGVRIAAQDVTPVQYSGQTCGINGTDYCCPMGVNQCTVEYYGDITLAEGGAIVPNTLYYLKTGEAGAGEICHVKPAFPDSPAPTWTRIEGFHQLDFCTWVLAPSDKCADFSPQSDDCKTANIAACFP